MTGFYLALGFLCVGLLVVAWVVMRRPEFWLDLAVSLAKRILINAKPLPPGDPQEKGRPQAKPVVTEKVIIKQNKG